MSRYSDIHFSVDLSPANEISRVISELAIALEDMGVDVSLRKTGLTRSINQSKRRRLAKMMKKKPAAGTQIKWTHYSPNYLYDDIWAEVTAEFFITDYLYGKSRYEDLNLWMKHVFLNYHRKLPVSSFCRQTLEQIGVAPERCAVVPFGYSSEVHETSGSHPEYERKGKWNFLAFTSFRHLYQSGTDKLIEGFGKAFTYKDPVRLLLKVDDFSKISDKLQEMISQWPEIAEVQIIKDFMPRNELMQIYLSSDCLVAPFRGEGFGTQIIDAMALKVPVIMPSFGGPLDYAAPGSFFETKCRHVKISEKTGPREINSTDQAWGVEVDSENLAEVLRDVFTNQQKSRDLGQKASEAIVSEFSWGKAANRLIKAVERFHRGKERKITDLYACSESKLDLSVIIPTKNRCRVLQKSLEKYCQAETPFPNGWEIIIIDDHSDEDVEATASEYADRLPLKVLLNQEHPGPGGARNTGIKISRGKILLITGDDIIPDEKFLSAHYNAHQTYPRENTAILGLTELCSANADDCFSHYVSKEGGQQFLYTDLKKGKLVPYVRFYTSNVSVKKSLLNKLEEIFCPHFIHAAYEDCELGYRLHRQGMKLIYWPDALAFHDHKLTFRQFAERQFTAGKMFAVWALRSPWAIPKDHLNYIHLAEFWKQGCTDRESKQNLAANVAKLNKLQKDFYQTLESCCQEWIDLAESIKTEDDNIKKIINTFDRETISFELRRIYQYYLESKLYSGMMYYLSMGSNDEERETFKGLAEFFHLMSYNKAIYGTSYIERCKISIIQYLLRQTTVRNFLFKFSHRPEYQHFKIKVKQLLKIP